jgi:hypothetical protein
MHVKIEIQPKVDSRLFRRNYSFDCEDTYPAIASADLKECEESSGEGPKKLW